MPRKAKSTKNSVKAAPIKERNYTIPGLLAIVAIVLITALFFQPGVALRAGQLDLVQIDPATNRGGLAYDTGAPAPTSTRVCEVSNICDGSRLVRQNKDCTHFIAYCNNGCDERPDGGRCL